jgi:photosystem II stability/assembly factor-like uncharacterized protein
MVVADRGAGALMRRALVLLALVLCGCGGSSSGASDDGRSSRLVDLDAEPPLINSFDVTEDESFLLTTNKGFFRISADGKDVERVRGVATAEPGSAPVGKFLQVEALPDGSLMGSGHPDRNQPLPEFLGFMRSDDDGGHWRIVSRLGEADLHRMILIHDRLYAFDAVLGAILVSEDGGRDWTEHFTPRELLVDFVVDPDDPKHLVAASESQIYASPDTGDGWRPVGEGRSPRLDWPAAKALMRADADGQFLISSDGGTTWERRGRIDGEPYKVRAMDAERAFVALSDGTIVETKDGGRTFATRFRP